VFLFIGAYPNTGWLNGSGITVDQHGFIRTGAGAWPRRSWRKSTHSWPARQSDLLGLKWRQLCLGRLDTTGIH